MVALAYQLFAVLCGWLEAILYAERAAESFDFNEHGGMLLQRIAACLLIPLGVLEYCWLGPWLLAAELVPMALLFPLSHDEAYNFTRLWLAHKTDASDGREHSDAIAWHCAWAEYRYGYQSPTTTARNDFNGQTRTWLAAAGGVALVCIFLSHFLHLFSF